MKYIGVVRRVDDLGRIVIPKEIRKALDIKEGAAIEFAFANHEGETTLVLKKYKP